MFNNLLKRFSPLLHRFFCYIKGISHDGLGLKLMHTNVGCNDFLQFFIFNPICKYRTREDLLNLFQFVIIILLEQNHPHNFIYTLTIYEFDVFSEVRSQLSYPLTFTSKYELIDNELFDNINWIKSPNLVTINNKNIVVIVDIKYSSSNRAVCSEE